jgi:diaminopimelate epimerase
MAAIRFAKMACAGNDFILLDRRAGGSEAPSPDWIARVCRGHFSVGADGLLLLGPAQEGRYGMRYFNADGSEAGMCGNGARCLARFAVLVGAVREGEEVAFHNAAGVYRAVVHGLRVRLHMPPPSGLETNLALKLKAGERAADFVHTGVPHVVFFTEDLDAEPVLALGREVRHHPRFAPAGTNVNFCQVLDPHRVRVRTYERGVEDETLACGTGSAAAGLTAAQRGWVSSPVAVLTRSGETLDLEFTRSEGVFTGLVQSGNARLIYWGELSEEASQYQSPVA